MHVLIAGCGWLGTAVALRLRGRGDRVTGVRSSPSGLDTLRKLGFEALELDLADLAAAASLPKDVDAVLAVQSAKGGRESDYRSAYLAVNHTLLEYARRHPLRTLVYTGSTGVFTQHDGSEVDEATPPAPDTASGQILLEAEQQLLEAARTGVPARLVRLSGLYGPGRTWMIERVQRGLMTLGPGEEAWLNSCHRDDAVETLLAVLDRGRNGALYHATDAQPLRRLDVIRHIAQRLEIEPVRSELAFEGPHRRIRGERTRLELGVRLQWPSLVEGLAPFFEDSHTHPSAEVAS
jgi:nucleoside-diphosphate-sugar epimerase